MRRVFTAKAGPCDFGSFSRASGVLVAQHQFPDTNCAYPRGVRGG